MTSVEERIEEEVAGRSLEEVDELILDECECTQLTAITDEYVNLEKLSAVACGLTTLKGFPSLKNLKKLDLSANQLSDTELTYLSGCTSLTHLILAGNPIKDLAGLEALKGHKALRKLDLTNTELSDAGDYRDKVFKLLDQIVFLDGLDRDDQEDEDDSEIEEEDGIDAEDDEDEGSEDENSEDDDEGGPGGDDDDDDEEDGDDDDEGDHERGVKRKHEDEEDV
jgi:hypothetical protein